MQLKLLNETVKLSNYVMSYITLTKREGDTKRKINSFHHYLLFQTIT